MHTIRIPPVDPAPATITAVLAMHAGHICPSYELLIRPRLSALSVSSLSFSPSSDVGFRCVLDVTGAWWPCTNTDAGVERPGINKCGEIPMGANPGALRKGSREIID